MDFVSYSTRHYYLKMFLQVYDKLHSTPIHILALQMSKTISFKEINKIAIPSMLAGIAEPLIALVDTSIIGKMPVNATEGLGAVGLGSQLFLFLFWIFMQTEASLSAITATSVGKGNEKSIEPLISQGLILNIFIGLSLFLVSNIFIDEIFNLYQAKGMVRDLGIEYFQIRSMGFPIALCTWMLWGVFRGLQNTSWAMYIGIGGGVMNLILDFALIYGIEGLIEPMGVKGAAYGSLIAQVLMLLTSIIVLYRKTIFRLVLSIKLHSQFKELLNTSKDFIIRAISLNLVIFLSNSFCTKYGNEEIAAHTIAMQLWIFSAFLLDGYANAGQAISGKLNGQNNWFGIHDITKKLIKVSIFVSFFMIIVFSIAKSAIGWWFTDDILVIQLLSTIMIYIIVFQPINGFAFTYDGIVKGILATVFIRNMMIFAAIIFIVCLLILDQLMPGIHAVWISLSIWMLFRSLSSFVYLKRLIRKKMN